MKQIILISVLMAGVLNCFAQPSLVDKVIAIVGDEIVLLSEIEMQYQQLLLEEVLEEGVKCEILSQMLLNKMLLTQAMVDSLVITEDDIEAELDRRLRHFIKMIGSKEKLEEYYQKSILEIKEEFRGDIKDYLLINKMQSKIVRDVKVTPSEVKVFFKEIPEDSLPYYNAEVELGQIVIFPKVSPFQREYAKEKIAKLRSRIVEGEDFGSLAEIYSEDASAIDGGEMGFHERGELVPEFEAVAYRLEENEVSKVVETTFGFHIIQLIERRGEKYNVKHILIKPKITSFELKKAKVKLDSIRNDIAEGKLLFSEAVNNYSEDEESKNNGGMMINPQTGKTSFEMDQLESGLYFIIDNLEVGQVSNAGLFNASDGKNGYRVIYLKSETQPHKANLKDDYHRIQSVALSNAQNETMKKWLSERIKETYIKIDKSYHDCSVISNWIN